MITEQMFDKRVGELYQQQRSRVKTKTYKTGARQGKVRVAGQTIPFTKDELGLWLWRQMKTQAILCPYCSAPIDILTVSLDHHVPLRFGGEVGLENLRCICRRCNTLKSDLMPREWELFLIFLRTLPTYARTSIETRLMHATGGLSQRRQASAKGEAAAPAKPIRAQRGLDYEYDPDF